MKFKFNSKYNTIAAYVLIVFVLGIIITAIILNLSDVIAAMGSIIRVLSPIIWGIIIAYLMNPIVKIIEKYISKPINCKKSRPALSRGISIFITSVIVISGIAALIAMAIPEIVSSIIGFLDNLPEYLSNLEKSINKHFDKHPELYDMFNEELSNIQKTILNWINKFTPQFTTFMNAATDKIILFMGGLKNAVIGFVISIYLLFSKETFLAQSNKLLHAIFKREKCEKLLSLSNQANKVFIGFISGKALDSLIIGAITFIFMHITNMPYVVLISAIICVTNMIPFFGPFIGAIPSAVLVLLSEPHKAIAFIIFVIVLQQIDGNIIGPKILGDSLGLPTFWIIFAILVGGGLFGFAGMLFGVPVFALIYTFAKDSIESALNKKHMPVETSAYKSLSVMPVSEKEIKSDKPSDSEN